MEASVGRFVVQEHFNNIQEIEFCVKYGVLDNVYMKFAGEQTDIDSVTEIVKDKLTRKFGNPRENKQGKHFFMWMDNQTGRMLILSDGQHDLLLSYGY